MIILASTSPRRQELLKTLNYDFMVVSPDFNEDDQDKDKNPIEYVKFLAYSKAKSIHYKYPHHIIIGADTIVVVDNQILEKPQDRQHAFSMLSQLKGRKHQVITAICILKDQQEIVYHTISDVYMKNYLDQDINNYIDSGECFDKAGSYAIQGLGQVLVEKYEGEFNNIVGLPLIQLKFILDQLI